MSTEQAPGTVSAQLHEADAAVRAEAGAMTAEEVVELARATFSAFMLVRDDAWLQAYAEDVLAGRPTTFAETGL